MGLAVYVPEVGLSVTLLSQPNNAQQTPVPVAPLPLQHSSLSRIPNNNYDHSSSSKNPRIPRLYTVQKNVGLRI